MIDNDSHLWMREDRTISVSHLAQQRTNSNEMGSISVEVLFIYTNTKGIWESNQNKSRSMSSVSGIMTRLFVRTKTVIDIIEIVIAAFYKLKRIPHPLLLQSCNVPFQFRFSTTRRKHFRRCWNGNWSWTKWGMTLFRRNWTTRAK